MATDAKIKVGVEGEKEYKAQITNIKNETKAWRSELDALKSSFDSSASAQEKNAKTREHLTSAIDAQKAKIETLKTSLEQASQAEGVSENTTLRMRTAIAEATTQLNAMQQELDSLPTKTELAAQKFKDFGQKCEEASAKWKAFGDGAVSTGRTLTRSVTAPIVGAAAAGVKYVADFDSSMSKVRALAGDVSADVSASVVAMAEETGKSFVQTGDATADAYAALEVIARQQAEVTKYTAGESADALSYMALAGWDVEEMAEGLPGVLNLAAASNMDLGLASDIVTDQLTAFGLSASESAHFADVLAQAQAKSNTTTEQMGEALSYVGPVAGSLGYTIDDVSVALGLMANSGIKGSTAGTTLRNVLSRMAKPTKESENAMKLLGLSLEDGEGNMLSFRQVMDQMRGGFGELRISQDELMASLSDLDAAFEAGEISETQYNDAQQELMTRAYGAEGALKAQAAAELAGQRGMSGLLAIVNAAPADYEALTSAIDNSNGAAENMALIMQDNLSGKLEILKSKLGETAFQFLGGFMPAIESVVEKIQGFVDKLNSLDESQKNTILTIAMVAAAVGPVITIIGRLAQGIGGVISLVGKVSTAIGALHGITSGFSLLMAGKVLLVIALVAAAITAIVLVIKNWGKITEWIKGVWEKVTTSIKNAITILQLKVTQAWNKIKETTTNVWNGIKTAISNVWNGIKTGVTNAVNTVKTKVSTAWDNVKTKTTNAWNNVKTAVSNAWNGIKSAASTAAENVKSKVSTAWDNLKTKTSTAWDNIKSTVDSKGGGIKGVISTLTDGYKSVWTSAFDTINTITGGRLGDALSTVNSILSSIKQAFWDKLYGAWENVRNIIDSIKSLFNFSWSLPHLALPHVSISGKFSLAPPSVPHFSISWYRRAYNQPMMFTSPTVLGTSGGLKGFGDGHGGEIVIGQSMMYGMIRAAVQDAALPQTGGGATFGDINVVVNGAPGQSERELADLVADRIVSQIQRKRAAGFA